MMVKRVVLIILLVVSLPAFAQEVPNAGLNTQVPMSLPVVEQSKQAEFTLDEYNAMIQLLDLGVKSGGLSVAEAGVVLMRKIQANISILQKKP